MSIIEAIILGIVQGLTEFIPVSSSGHLVILHEWLGITEVGLAFDVALHFGTLLALLLFFYKEIGLLVGGLLGKNNYQRLAWLIAAATVPAALAGVLIKNLAETSFRSVTLVAINLIVVALLMLWAEAYGKRYKNKIELEGVSTSQGLSIGLAQALALVPGVSRSGATITAGIFLGLDRVAATRFSFLLAIPAIGGALVKVLIDGGLNELSGSVVTSVVGVIAAFVSGLFAIRFLIGYLAKHDLSVFAYYRIALGVIALITVAVL